MKLKAPNLWIWPASLMAGFSLAYSAICHWFGFLNESKINRVELLLVFGSVFFFLCWQLLRWGSRIFFENLPRRTVYLFLGAAVATAGVAALSILPSWQEALLTVQAQPVGSPTPVMQILWIGLRLVDFVNLASLLFLVEAIFATIVSHWKLISRVLPRILAVFFPLGAVLLICLAANLVISARDNLGTFKQLTHLSSNSLIALDQGSDTFLQNIRVDAVFLENYQGWTLFAPSALLNKLEINANHKLIRWGRLKSVSSLNYPAELTDQEMKHFLNLKNVHVENGTGLEYYAILDDVSDRKICLRTYQNDVFVIPVSLSPICEKRQ